MAKVGRNEPYPCGSGRKFKKCCGDTRTSLSYTAEDRASAFAHLDEWIDAFAEDEAEDAHELFWGRFLDDADELPEDLAIQSETVEDIWFAFDYVSDRGAPAIDTFLAEAELVDSERAFLTALRQSTMRLYEIVHLVPGVSLTLRDAIEGGQVTINERRGSRQMGRHMYLAARVVPRGPSGGPEMEAGVLHIPGLVKDAVIAQIRAYRATFLDEHRGAPIDGFYKQMPPFFHEVWAGSFLDAYVPTPQGRRRGHGRDHGDVRYRRRRCAIARARRARRVRVRRRHRGALDVVGHQPRRQTNDPWNDRAPRRTARARGDDRGARGARPCDDHDRSMHPATSCSRRCSISLLRRNLCDMAREPFDSEVN
jgi:hypothetical protein